MKFIEKPANNYTIAFRKPVLGVGINDVNYITEPLINNKRVKCPYYVKWTAMIKRCYSESFQQKFPTYKECVVCDEWLLFSNFRAWMKAQDWKGKHLDKDILIQGNKIYSPDTCLFVDANINYLLGTNNIKRGKYPIGVSFFKRDGNFKAQCKVDGRQKHIGYYSTIKKAYDAYKEFKYKVISDVAIVQKEPLRTALLNYVII